MAATSPEKSISDELDVKCCQEFIFTQKLLLLQIVLGHILKTQKKFSDIWGPVKGRKIVDHNLLFFGYSEILWFLRN